MGDSASQAAAPPGAAEAAGQPLLMVDIDGVISLFAGEGGQMTGARPAPEGTSLHSIEGIPHFLSGIAAAHLLDLAEHFELVWASGWEERANENLPHLLGLPHGMPFLRFDRGPVTPRRDLAGARAGTLAAHWKLEAIERHAGARPLAWIDDALDSECEAWATARAAPTLLVQTDPRVGLTDREVEVLMRWARGLER